MWNMERRRKRMVVLLSAVLAAGLCVCARAGEEVVVFAAASMTETLSEIGEMYEKEHPEISVIFNFDSSGTLKTQIEEGAACDVFISAGQKQMNELDIDMDEEKNPDRLDYVFGDTRIDLLENKVTLVVPKDDPKQIESFDDLAKLLQEGDILMAMGNSDVPVGQYTQKILDFYHLDEAELAKAGKLTYGTNVKEVTTQVAEGSVDCGVIYATDAFSAGLDAVDTATPEMCGQVIYPAAVMKSGADREAGEAFLAYLTSEKAGAVFEKVGFTPLLTD